MKYKNKNRMKRVSIMTESDTGKVRKGVETDYKEHLVEHLRELRNRIIYVMIVLFVATFLIYPFSGDILNFLWDKLLPENVTMSIYAPTDFIMTKIKLSIACAVGIAFPFLMYQLFRFMSRGLYKNEKRFFLKVVPVSYILFIIGASIAYFIILPIFMSYIIYYSDMTAAPQVSLTETINSVIVLVLGLGFVFQIPLLTVIAVEMGIIEVETVKKYRIAVYLFIFSLAFFLTPDPTFLAQVIVGISLIILFEMGLLLVRLF